jgi:hypothetical protein
VFTWQHFLIAFVDSFWTVTIIFVSAHIAMETEMTDQQRQTVLYGATPSVKFCLTSRRKKTRIKGNLNISEILSTPQFTINNPTKVESAVGRHSDNASFWWSFAKITCSTSLMGRLIQ